MTEHDTPTELLTAGWLTLAQAARLLPTKPAPSTLWRWARKGLRGIRLEYRRLGGRIVVTEDALRRFMEELTKVDHQSVPRFAERTESGSERRQMSREELEAALRHEQLW